ncbi:MAG: hypothetical protein ABIF85_01330 [Nanoarchaeota archaeon]
MQFLILIRSKVILLAILGAVAQFAEHIHLSVICKAKTESFKILAFNAKI